MPDDEQVARRLTYLTTEQVKARYGFDPTPFMERHEAGGNFIYSKLVPVNGQLIRVWLESEVAAHPSAKKGG